MKILIEIMIITLVNTLIIFPIGILYHLFISVPTEIIKNGFFRKDFKEKCVERTMLFAKKIMFFF